MAKALHALTRMTISPNVAKGGAKTNVIAGQATLDVGNASPPQSDFVGALREAARQCMTPDAELVPMLLTGASDMRFYRDVGAQAYGFSLFDENLKLAEITALAHGDDERISIGTLRLTAKVYERLARNFLGGDDLPK